MSPVPKGIKTGRIRPKRLQDSKHLAFVAEKPCCCCGAIPVHAHHLLKGDPKRGMNRKAGDNYTIPLCLTHHDGLHNFRPPPGEKGGEVKYLEQYGVDGPKLAAELWSESHE